YERNAVNKNESTLIQTRRQLQDAEQALDKRRLELRADLAKRLHQKIKSEYETALVQAQDDVRLLAEHEKKLRVEVENLGKEVDKNNTPSAEVETLRAEIKREEEFTEKIGSQLEQLKVEQRSPPRVNVYQEAALQKKDIKKQVF